MLSHDEQLHHQASERLVVSRQRRRTWGWGPDPPENMYEGSEYVLTP